MKGKAFTPSHVRNDPLIYSGRSMKRTEATPAGASGNKNHTVATPPEVTEQKGDLLIMTSGSKGQTVFTKFGS